MSENEKNYISRQISVYKTDKKLVEFIDKLKPAPAEYYAHIHSFGDKDESGVRQISCIGITLQNYTNGTGKNIKRVSANISPDEAEYIFNQLQNGVQEFNFQQEKIFGTPDESGRSRVTKLRIIRAVTGSDGKPRRYPWYVEIANGTGEKVKKDNGGIFMKANSYQEQNKEYINLNDMDFYKLMIRVSKYIKAWEATVAPHIITEGKQAIAQMQEEGRS